MNLPLASQRHQLHLLSEARFESHGGACWNGEPVTPGRVSIEGERRIRFGEVKV
jgi:hypothetical protein